MVATQKIWIQFRTKLCFPNRKRTFLKIDFFVQDFKVVLCAEMEKRADGADASVLIFSLCCANFLAVNGKIAKTFDVSTLLFFA